jgi:hypothetical protein
MVAMGSQIANGRGPDRIKLARIDHFVVPCVTRFVGIRPTLDGVSDKVSVPESLMQAWPTFEEEVEFA